GRIMALADVYDALSSKRVYKDAYSHEVARKIIVDGSGTQFDPDIVTAFLACEEQFVAITSASKSRKSQRQNSASHGRLPLVAGRGTPRVHWHSQWHTT